MSRTCLAAALLLWLSLGASAQNPEPAPTDARGPYLGVLVSPVPEVLYAQLPLLPRLQGVVVTQVFPDSPAALARLQRLDILLAYDGQPIQDCFHFAKLVREDRVDRKVKLVLLRGGREISADVSLTLGPILTVAQASAPIGKDQPEPPRGTAKSTGPAKVSVSVTPLEERKMRVTVEYYPDGTGKLETVTCSGTALAVEKELQKLPPRVQELARSALQRIRTLESQKDNPTKSALDRNGR